MNFNQKLVLMTQTRGGHSGEKKLVPDRGRNWGYHETMDLLTLWSDDGVQAELEASVRNQHVYEKISTAMLEKGHPRTAEQCRDKVKKLKKDYNDVVSNKTTLSRAMCKYFEVMDKVMRGRGSSSFLPAIEAEVLLDVPAVTIKIDPDGPGGSGCGQIAGGVVVENYGDLGSRGIEVNGGHPSDLSQSPSETSENHNDADYIRQEALTLNGHGDDSSGMLAGDGIWIPPVQANRGNGNEGSTTSASAMRIGGPMRRRRKINKTERMMVTIVDRFVDSIRDAECRFVALEERRLRAAIELEERRQEREERRRREERQHELKMLGIITQAIVTIGNVSNPDSRTDESSNNAKLPLTICLDEGVGATDSSNSERKAHCSSDGDVT